MGDHQVLWFSSRSRPVVSEPDVSRDHQVVVDSGVEPASAVGALLPLATFPVARSGECPGRPDGYNGSPQLSQVVSPSS